MRTSELPVGAALMAVVVFGCNYEKSGVPTGDMQADLQARTDPAVAESRGSGVSAERRCAFIELRDKAKQASQAGARAYAKALEEAISTGALTTAEVFDTDYQPMQTPPDQPRKYHTRYDGYTDRILPATLDGFLDEAMRVVFAIGVDKNGYCPTHNTRFQDRAKRIFDDQIGYASATNTQPGHITVYVRDTGQLMWDVSTPIYVGGQHWGAFRLGICVSCLWEQAPTSEEMKLLKDPSSL
jgi:hypothetical protein